MAKAVTNRILISGKYVPSVNIRIAKDTGKPIDRFTPPVMKPSEAIHLQVFLQVFARRILSLVRLDDGLGKPRLT